MKNLIKILLIGIITFTSCKSTEKKSKIDLDNIYAWCIVPYDSLKRTPIERINMLKEIGIRKYAYDWRDEHLTTMAEELLLAKKNGVDVISIWLWIDNNTNTIEKLSESNERLFQIIEEVNYNGQIWVSFHANFFENLSDDEAVEKGTKIISKLSKRASALNCKIALYNHGDWFGEPENQIKIIKNLPSEDLGLIYNFHHAHHQIDSFSELATTMMPYLWSVNLNGLRKGGPKILTVGDGDFEKLMIHQLIESGYNGDFGILGHKENSDVRKILISNLKGLNKINANTK
ncbi:AP endonuclease [Kriegella sp. EG-1]|nr:AP endonuclease [Flavobacteriaceae bacterium EG-1]